MIARKRGQIRHMLVVGLLLNSLFVSCAPSLATPPPIQTPSKPAPPVASATPPAVTETPQEVRVTPEFSNAYLTNPGMGWQDGPEPYGFMNFPETVAYANRRDIAWSELNPARGVYTWYALDEQLEKAVEGGKQFSFRIYTFVGEDYDGSKVPDWVIEEGARLNRAGEPDYSNCVYQDRWGEFVNELVRVYDGNPAIAFIDISGYGSFNEWSWEDGQTRWDDSWDEDYANGTPSAGSFRTLDGQARRRLADIFIGGSFKGHACRTVDGATTTVDYAYPGFQKTQLLMPYAGIVQSSQYVYSRRTDVGFRHDCLGRDGQHLFEKIGSEIQRVWMQAPVVYELCKPGQTDAEDAAWLLKQSHASIVHNNHWRYSLGQLEEMMLPVGYRYYLKEFQFNLSGAWVEVEMEWQNLGLAPSYPKMGQDFRLVFNLVDDSGRLAFQDPVPADISTWMPADSSTDEAPRYPVSHRMQIPSYLEASTYQVGVSIIDQRTGLPLNLDLHGRDGNGVYILFSIEI